MSINTAAIRKLLGVAFNDEELTAFCYDYFRPVHDKFANQMGRQVKIQLLIEHCDKFNLFNELLTQVENENPYRYTEFLPSIKEPTRTSNVDASASRRELEVIFRGSLLKVTPELQTAAVGALAGVLNISRDEIDILRIYTGSIILYLEMPTEAANQLVALFEVNDPIIEDLGIQQVRIIEEKSSTTGWWLTLHIPEQVSYLVTILQTANLLKPYWWFAWNDLEMRLPGQMTQVSELDDDWEVLRIFSPQAELRLGPMGQQRGCWLLLEQAPQQALGQSFYQSWVIGEVDNFRVEAGYHLLAGEQLKLPQGVQRGQVSYPRPLDYQFGSNTADLDKIIVAEVRKYYDATNRLSTVRYAGLELRDPGPNSLRVQPLPTPEIALPLRGEKR